MTSSIADTDLLNKHRTILEIVLRTIQQSRQARGLCPLFAVDSLGDVAYSLSESLILIDKPDPDMMRSEFARRVYAEGYAGRQVNVSFFRSTWSLDKPETEIAAEILGFCTKSQEDYWEDYGFGVSWNVSPEAPGTFGLGLVLGLGYTDGSSLVAYHINEVRKRAGIPPLEMHSGLRHMARNYIALDEEPEHQKMLADLGHVGYSETGDQVRYAYVGSYAPFPTGRVVKLNVSEVAMMVANQLLRDHRETLSRPDWQHIGISIKPEAVLTPDEPRKPSILAELLVAWRLDGDAERHAHFPVSVGGRTATEPKTTVATTPQAKRSPRRWWPFS